MENTNPSFDPVFYQFEPGSHEKKRVIWIRFPYRKDLVQALRQTVRARWSRSEKAWYIADTTVHRNLFGLPLNVLGRDWEKKISPENFAELEKCRSHLVLKAYALTTLRTYCSEFAQLLQILGTHSVKALSPERLQSYFLFCHQELKHSENQIHSRMNAVKFYLPKVLRSPINVVRYSAGTKF